MTHNSTIDWGCLAWVFVTAALLSGLIIWEVTPRGSVSFWVICAALGLCVLTILGNLVPVSSDAKATQYVSNLEKEFGDERPFEQHRELLFNGNRNERESALLYFGKSRNAEAPKMLFEFIANGHFNGFYWRDLAVSSLATSSRMSRKWIESNLTRNELNILINTLFDCAMNGKIGAQATASLAQIFLYFPDNFLDRVAKEEQQGNVNLKHDRLLQWLRDTIRQFESESYLLVISKSLKKCPSSTLKERLSQEIVSNGEEKHLDILRKSLCSSTAKPLAFAGHSFAIQWYLDQIISDQRPGGRVHDLTEILKKSVSKCDDKLLENILSLGSTVSKKSTQNVVTKHGWGDDADYRYQGEKTTQTDFDTSEIFKLTKRELQKRKRKKHRKPKK